MPESGHHPKSSFYALLIGCIGVVYGDIGTSPLYAFREAIARLGSDSLEKSEVLGILSLILWALILVVTVKYVFFLLRLDNKGEGGILSLMALASKRTPGTAINLVTFLGIIGVALFYGDATITPAISVLSAVEGLTLVSPAFERFTLLLAIVILIVLFMVQKNGTGKVSSFFGPITAIWFLVLGGMGICWIIQEPSVLVALNPYYAVAFLFEHGSMSFFVLGSIFLAVTGAEALYVDLGHFGRKPIQTAWFFFVFPCLVLNYFGQGALVLENPAAAENSFFLLVPESLLLPLVGLATVATIIASQAVITGAFSLTSQAVQLGFLPRLEIRHTSETQEGQIYMPKINTALMLAVLFLCLVFKNSSSLANAYGIAVTGDMIVTTLLATMITVKVKKKPLKYVLLAAIPFFTIEAVFLSANALKIADGGFVPVLFALFNALLIVTWINGTRYLYVWSKRQSVTMKGFIEALEKRPPTRVKGTAIFMTSDPQLTPVALLHNIKHNKVLHEQNLILTVQTEQTPRVKLTKRLTIEPVTASVTRVVMRFGFMETPDIPRALLLGKHMGLDIDPQQASYFLGRRTIISDPNSGLSGWQDNIYIALSRTAATATSFYRIPPNRIVELGTQIAV